MLTAATTALLAHCAGQTGIAKAMNRGRTGHALQVVLIQGLAAVVGPEHRVAVHLIVLRLLVVLLRHNRSR